MTTNFADNYFSFALPYGFDPPHQSDTRTIYIANRFPQYGHYTPQKFIDNRIISSKVRINTSIIKTVVRYYFATFISLKIQGNGGW